MVRIWFPTEGARKIESWGPGITRLGKRQSGRRVSRVPEIPRRTSTRWSSSPPVIPGRVSSGIPGGLRHNSREFPAVIIEYKFPRRWQRRPGITPDAGIRVALVAWCYTMAAGPGVVHVAATGFQGIPDCVARYKFPR